jgi:3-deoxy-D-manno-octulosonic-acid transferase
MTRMLARLALSSYRWIGTAVYPLVWGYLAARAAKGKEDSARRQERYGYASARSPARAAGLVPCRQRRRNHCHHSADQ